MTLAVDLAGAWDPAWPVLLCAAVALALFAQAFRRLRARGRSDHAPWSRAGLFALGVAVLTLALVSPLDAAGEEYLLTAHVLQHELILDVAPALLLVALRGPLTFFFLPACVLGPLGRVPLLRSALRALLRPRYTLAFWAAVVAGWHVPQAYDCALVRPWAHELQHALFLVVGLLVWSQLIDPARRHALSTAGRAGFAVGLFAAEHAVLHPAFFGSGVLYARYKEQGDRLLGLTPLADQHLAAWVMTAGQALVLGLFLVLLLRRERPAALAAESVM